MTPKNLWNIHAVGNSCSNTLMQHGTKTTPVFLLADGEVSWLLLPRSVSLTTGSTVQPENTFLYPQCDRSGLRKRNEDKHQH